MQSELSTKGKYRIITIDEVLHTTSNIADLIGIIDELLQQDTVHIAIRFKEGSFFTSRTGAIVINCWEKITNNKGTLTLVEPGYDIRHFFLVLELDKEIAMVDSIEDLTD